MGAVGLFGNFSHSVAVGQVEKPRFARG
jgi:hypothetical protein